MSSESLTPQQKRLIYQSWHRGTKECDLILGPFAEEFVLKMTEDELTFYEKLMTADDQNIYAWVTQDKKIPLPEQWDHPLIHMLRGLVKNG